MMTETIEKTESDVAEPMEGMARASRRAVVVHSGARDAYQMALALEEAGLLEALVTDLFWPADSGRGMALAKLLPARVRGMLLQRSESRLAAGRVRLCAGVGLAALVADKMPRMPLAVRRWVTRTADARLGGVAGRLAKRTGSATVSYSYYGYDAFRSAGRPGMLFQMHPHPVAMRRILGEELAAHPDCAASLQQEWELALPEVDFAHLVRETEMAAAFMVASSFTRKTLIEEGGLEQGAGEHRAGSKAIRVIPYGVDCARFRPDVARRGPREGRLRMLFVGRINQRKGIKYLLEALRLLDTTQAQVTVCGRVVDGLELFRAFEDRVTVRPSVSAAELVAAYQAADLFVFPSVAEGFGQVLLESLACGLPILSTTHTAAPDLIEEGREGFVVEPRRPEQLAARMEWALTHRAELAAMGERARATAETFTWERFRRGVAGAVGEFLQADSIKTEGGDHV